MGILRSIVSLLLKLAVVCIVLATVGVVILAFVLKKDVEEIREFTEKVKKEIEIATS